MAADNSGILILHILLLRYVHMANVASEKVSFSYK